jgi:F0F1-type ATP synthase assembly protein I
VAIDKITATVAGAGFGPWVFEIAYGTKKNFLIVYTIVSAHKMEW